MNTGVMEAEECPATLYEEIESLHKTIKKLCDVVGLEIPDATKISTPSGSQLEQLVVVSKTRVADGTENLDRVIGSLSSLRQKIGGG